MRCSDPRSRRHGANSREAAGTGDLESVNENSSIIAGMLGAGSFAPPPQSSVPEAAPSAFTRAIETAAQGSHTPFSTLVAIAGAESSFRADARSRMSSAAGPFQITESTWLHLVKTYGAAAGRPDLAARVRVDASGHFSVAAEDKPAVLEARHDIGFSSRLAARFCDECRSGLARKLGRPPSEEDVRLAYFLGVNGATRLITAAAARPGETVRALLPRAFANHRGMFSHHGRPLNAEQALSTLEARFSAQIARGDALKSYAGANALADNVAAAAASDATALASADAAAAVFAAAASAAAAPADALAMAAPGEAAAPATAQSAAAPTPPQGEPATAQSVPAVQMVSAGTPKPLACTPAADGGVSCAL